MGAKPARCLSFSLCAPAVASFNDRACVCDLGVVTRIKPFPPQVTSGYSVYQCNRKRTRMEVKVEHLGWSVG